MKQITAALVGLVLLVGCVTNPQTGKKELDPAAVRAITKQVVYVSSSLYLDSHPQTRAAFGESQIALQALIDGGGKLDGALVLKILNGLPIKQMSSAQAFMVVQSGTIIFDVITHGGVDVLSNDKIAAFANGVNDGLKLTLGIPIPN